MLTKLELENFKCFKKVAVEPRLVTVSIGPNGSGKSSLFQALMLLKQSQGSQELRMAGPYINLGNFDDLVHEPARAQELAIALEDRRMVVLPPSPFGIDKANALLSYRLTFKAGQVSQSDALFEFNGLRLGRGKARRAWVDYELDINNQIGNPFSLVRAGPAANVPTEEPEKEFAAQKARELQPFVSQVSQLYGQVISGFHLVPAMRGLDRPNYRLGTEEAGDFISAEGYEKQIENLTSTFAYRREFLEKKIEGWFHEVTGVRIAVALRPAYTVSLMAESDAVLVNIVNEGFGSNQLTHLLGQLALAPQDSLICIEEPEIHLHPRAQAKLVEVLVEVAEAENKQIWVSTHSEHVILALLTAVAKGTIKMDDLAIYYFEKEKGTASASKLEVDGKGRIRGGLRGFFEAEVEQPDTYMKALLGRE